MKKTIFFAKKHLVKDKIKSFSIEMHPQFGPMTVIEFIDDTHEVEYFNDEDFINLLRSYEHSTELYKRTKEYQDSIALLPLKKKKFEQRAQTRLKMLLKEYEEE